MVNRKVLTNVQRAIWKFVVDSSCFHCPGEPENLLHLFRDCAKARLIWNAFNVPNNMRSTFVLDWRNWLFANLLQDRCMIFNMPWNVFFSFVVWHIWKWRCKCIFDRDFNLPTDAKGIIYSCMEEWKRANEKVDCRMDGEDTRLFWHRPSPGWVKLNVDGARSNEGTIGAGGVLRNCEGAWQCGFMATLGVGDVLQAEAWAMLHGLQMAAEEGAGMLEVESDSATLVRLLLDGWTEVHPLGSLLLSCKRLMQRFTTCCLRHVHREENFAADVLAKASLEGQIGCHVLRDVPQMVIDVLIDDMAGRSRLRNVKAKLQSVWSSNVDGCNNAA